MDSKVGREKNNSVPPQPPLWIVFEPSKVSLHGELKWQIPELHSLTASALPKNPQGRNYRFPGKNTHTDMEINTIEIKAMPVRCPNGPNTKLQLNLKVIK